MAELIEQHEAFALSISNGQSLTQAAISAGYPKTSAANTGSRLMKRTDVRARILKLKGDAEATQTNIVGNKDWVLRKMVDNYEVAAGVRDAPENASPAVARAQLLDIARVQGFITLKPDLESRRIKPDKDLPPTQLHAVLVDLFGKLAPTEREQLALDDPELVESIDADYTVTD